MIASLISSISSSSSGISSRSSSILSSLRSRISADHYHRIKRVSIASNNIGRRSPFTSRTTTRYDISTTTTNKKHHPGSIILPPHHVDTSTSTSSISSINTSITNRGFETCALGKRTKKTTLNDENNKPKPGSVAFAECETAAMTDLFHSFAQSDCNDLPSLAAKRNSSQSNKMSGSGSGSKYLTLRGVRELLVSIGERPDEETLIRIFTAADTTKNGKLSLDEFLTASDLVLGGAPARIVIVVGGPGSGKGLLCDRLAKECGVVHLSSGHLLRDEVKRGTPLGKECEEIMKRGELVSSAVITTLIRRHSRSFPGQRVLLDGFPRSVENANDFLDLIGKPELALHLDCDDTILMERIMKRGQEAKANAAAAVNGNSNGDEAPGEAPRADDNFETAIQRLRTFHKYHHSTMDWLRDQHVPVVNLDCGGTPENVWSQLLAIGRLMRPAAHLGNGSNSNGKKK
jgi:adenylate kinase